MLVEDGKKPHRRLRCYYSDNLCGKNHPKMINQVEFDIPLMKKL